MLLRFFVVVIAYLVRGGLTDDSNILPNSTCTRTGEWAYFITACRAQGYRLPSNFNVTRLDPAVTNLVITGYDAAVEENYVPFPYRENLTTILLMSFNQRPNDSPFPLAGLFINIRGTIKTLILSKVKLLKLETDQFRGYGQLQDLSLSETNLASISMNTFAEIGFVKGATFPRASSSLKRLTVDSNPMLVDLDWSFLIPVSDQLESVQVSGSGITSDRLACSIPFGLKRLQTIHLQGNRLRTLPSFIFDTLQNASLIVLDGQDQPFCRNCNSCSCCDLYDFARWIYAKNNTVQAYSLCGRNGTWTTLSTISLTKNPDLGTILQCTGSNQQQPSCSASETFHDEIQVLPYSTAVSTTKFPPTAPAGCVPDSPTSVLTMQCIKTKLTFSSNDFNDTDALTGVLTVDNTMKCRTVMHDAHEWIEARIRAQRGWTTTRPVTTGTTGRPLVTTRSNQLVTTRTTQSGRGKRDIQRYLPMTVVNCQKGNLTASDDEPDMSEAIKLTFTTTGSLSCRKIFVEFLAYISRMQ